jgi:hypothetical protein
MQLLGSGISALCTFELRLQLFVEAKSGHIAWTNVARPHSPEVGQKQSFEATIFQPT